MKQIFLNKGKIAMVDDCDFVELSKFVWTAIDDRGRWYAVRNGGKGKASIKMHRQIMGLTDPRVIVDHQNGNGLDCQRHNLRVATKSQNAMNTRLFSTSTTGYKGVSKCKKRGDYRAYIVKDYKQKSLGRFDCPVKAAKAYDEAAKDLYGEFCRLNFPINK
jgi:hypothetical protein